MDHASLLREVENNANEIFNEDIHWVEMNIPGEDRPIRPDMAGYDANGRCVIVELKPFGYNDYDAPRTAMGQILHYATAYLEKHLKDDPRNLSSEQLIEGLKSVRLFIISDRHSNPTEKMCALLETHDINICYISLDCI